MIVGLHNHGLSSKLVGHLIVYRMNSKEKKLIFKITMNKVHPKNILTTLKEKDPKVSKILSKYTMFATKTTRR